MHTIFICDNQLSDNSSESSFGYSSAEAIRKVVLDFNANGGGLLWVPWVPRYINMTALVKVKSF